MWDNFYEADILAFENLNLFQTKDDRRTATRIDLDIPLLHVNHLSMSVD